MALVVWGQFCWSARGGFQQGPRSRTVHASWRPAGFQHLAGCVRDFQPSTTCPNKMPALAPGTGELATLKCGSDGFCFEVTLVLA